jgi:hypothetical protein
MHKCLSLGFPAGGDILPLVDRKRPKLGLTSGASGFGRNAMNLVNYGERAGVNLPRASRWRCPILS